MRRLAAVAYVTLAMGLAAVGCTNTSASTQPTTTTTTVTPTTTTTLPLGPAAEFCAVVVQYEQTLVRDFIALILPNPEPGVAEKTVAEIRMIADELHRTAPPEIAESGNALAAEAKVLLDAFVASGYDVTKIKDQLASSKKALDAVNEVLGFAKTRCGIKTTMPTSP